MRRDATDEATRYLARASVGDANATRALGELTYDRLRQLAAREMRAERRDHTLQPTALVHEVYLRLLGQSQVDWQDRDFFLRLAAREMRRVLVDHARARRRLKRGGGRVHVALDDAKLTAGARDLDLLDLDEALEKLAQHDERLARVVELRFFGGLTIAEIARSSGLSVGSVERDWRLARARLHRLLRVLPEGRS